MLLYAAHRIRRMFGAPTARAALEQVAVVERTVKLGRSRSCPSSPAGRETAPACGGVPAAARCVGTPTLLRCKNSAAAIGHLLCPRIPGTTGTFGGGAERDSIDL